MLRRGVYGAVVFFELQHGVKLALWPRTSIAHDTHLSVHTPGATDCTLAHTVRSKEEVDLVMHQAKAAGVTILKAAQETFYGGYAGYFQDPDQHIWEIAWNPELLPDSPHGLISHLPLPAVRSAPPATGDVGLSHVQACFVFPSGKRSKPCLCQERGSLSMRQRDHTSRLPAEQVGFTSNRSRATTKNTPFPLPATRTCSLGQRWSGLAMRGEKGERIRPAGTIAREGMRNHPGTRHSPSSMLAEMS